MDADFLYFAYGSNLLSRRLRERTPSATALGRGVLAHHVLRWHMASIDGSGKCDVIEADSQVRSAVHGVVYRIARTEKRWLDQAESLGVGYRDEQVLVHLDGQAVKACIYRALSIDVNAVPYDWYMAVVIAGAREQGLPDDYLALLLGVPTKTDPDRERARRHFALAHHVVASSLPEPRVGWPSPAVGRAR